MSKENGKSTSKSKAKPIVSKRKTKKKNNGRYHVLSDYKITDQSPPAPPQFNGDFRVLRQMLRWAKRYAILREGRLHLYASRQDMERNHAWRTIDLARSVVSYRSGDRRILINTPEPAPEIFKVKTDKGKLDQWVAQLKLHRQYAQAKLVPIPPKIIQSKPTPQIPPPTPLPPPPVVGQTIPTDAKIEASNTIANLEHALDKLEETTTTENQREYLNLAKEAQSKLRTLLSVTNGEQLQKWVPPSKAKKQAASVPIPIQPQPQSPVQEKPKQSTAFTILKQTPPMPTIVQETPPSPAPATPFWNKPAKLAAPPPAEPEVEIPPSPPLMYVPSISSGASSPASSGVETGRSTPVTPVTTDMDDTPSVDEQREKFPDSDVSERSDEGETSPAKVPVYRQKLPAPMGPQPSIFKLAMSAIGRDVMQFSLPATIMEPLSMLQIMCEELEYSELIDQAVGTSEAHMRMVYVACFAVSRYGSTAYRSGRKPFNPLLGQTFQFNSPHLGWQFVAEQVQHRPSVSAGYAEGRGWKWWQDAELMVTFGGSSLEAKPVGLVNLYLEKWKETYKWSKVTSSVGGLLSGNYVLDHHGEMIVECEETEMKAHMHFKKSTKNRRGEIDGKIMDGRGRVQEQIFGSWCDSLYAAALPPEYAKYYGMTRFALALNEYRPEVHGALPKTDSRFRPDMKALEMGKPTEADKIKKEIEENQRKRRKEMEAGKRPQHQPLWFRQTGNTVPSKGSRWTFNQSYWKAKEKEFKGVRFLPLW